MISVKPDHLLYRSKLGSDSDEDDTDASKESEENSNAKSQGLESNEIYDISDSEDDDVIEVKQPQEATSSQSIMLEPRLIPTTSAKDIVRIVENPDVKYCTQIEYSNQASIVANLRTDLLKCKNTMRTMNLDNLPDKGARLKLRVVDLEQKLFAADSLLKKMYVETKEIQANKPVSWEQLKTNAASVIPRTLGERAMQTYATQKALTMDRLKSLHDSLATCPADSVLAEDPKGLKVELMTHQKRALAWLIWREHQKPSGGILADDMGLGKTLTMISLVAYRKQQAQELDHQSSDSETENGSGWRSKSKSQLISGGTLVICPATLIRQWEAEVDNRCKRHLISVELYHGVKRENKAARLAKYDMVITTYKLAMGEFEKKGPLFRIKWKRIILDEAHVVRNHKSQTSLAVCGLSAVSRWTLTGTPVHNKELDLYALLKFLRCHPFDDIAIWKHWVANKNAGGQERLNTVMTSILLRRTKEELQNNGALKGLPERKYELIQVDLDNAEKQIYQKVLVFSRTLFVQFLHQRKEKDLDVAYANPLNNDDHLKKLEQTEYLKMHQKLLKMSGTREVQSHEILVLLLRLRQICCHPSLIIGMLNGENEVDDSFEEDTHVDLIDKINNMKLDDNDDASGPSATQTGAENITNKLLNIDLNDENEPPENFGTAINKVLSLSNPVFAKNRPNEKIRVIKKIITEKVIPQGDKLIIVSQWTSMLNVVYEHLKADSIRCDMLDGKVPVPKRNEMVVNFNDPKHRTKVLLLSLTAGGVGLNLVGANHLILLDLHWNPQLESQAQDRIYRVGQKKTVVIYKLVTTDTIEERIKALQEHKLSMASDILSGTRTGANKLTLDDLKMLFS